MQKVMRHVIVLFLFVFTSWSIYRSLSHFPQWVDDFIAKPLLWLPAVYYFVTIEKKPLFSLGLSLKQFRKNLFIGLIGSAVLTAELVISVELRNNFHFRIPGLSLSFLLFTFFSSLATAIVEEIVFRGYIQSRLMKIFKEPVVPIGMSSLLFIIVHFPLMVFVLHYSIPQMISYSILIGVLGVIDGYLFLKTKTLTAPIIVHTIWDFMSSIIH